MLAFWSFPESVATGFDNDKPFSQLSFGIGLQNYLQFLVNCLLGRRR